MAVPKRKTSKTKKRQRAGGKGLRAPSLASCARCNQAVLPHRVCGNCGYYGRRKVIEVEEA
ncbi:MAG: 50S ribosomal protein L32 [Planctomycetota bacterium]